MPATIHIIANGGAKGMTEPRSRDAFAELVERELAGAELTFTDEGTDVEALVRSAVDKGAEMVVAGGGDGTVNSVASILVDTRTTLGVLPLGTLNHFAKDVGVPVDVEDAVRTLATGRVAHVDVGQVNDRIFVNNSGLGLYPDIVFNREERQRKGSSKWPAAFLEGMRAVMRYRLLRIDVDVEGRVLRRRTPAVFVGNNEYSMEHTLATARHSLSDGQLCLYIPHPTGRVGLAWFSLRALFGNPQSGPEFDRFLAAGFTIDSRSRSLRVSIDGEVTRLTTPLEYKVRPGALRVMVPSLPA